MKANRHVGTQDPRLLCVSSSSHDSVLVSLSTASGADFIQKYTFSNSAWTDYLSTQLSSAVTWEKKCCL